MRPTALVVIDWREFDLVSCFLRDRGLAIPGDVSLVLLSDHPSMECFLPALTHIEQVCLTRTPVSARSTSISRTSPAWVA